MKIKRKIKKFCGAYPFNRYEDKKHKLKFNAEVYEDGFGWFEMVSQGIILKNRSNGRLNAWIHQVEGEIYNLQKLLTFLDNVRYLHEAPENSLKES